MLFNKFQIKMDEPNILFKIQNINICLKTILYHYFVPILLLKDNHNL